MKFVLLVEGHTEKKAAPAFIKRWLDSRLTQPVGVQPVRFDGWAEYLRDVAQKAIMYIEAPKQDVIAVIGLLDLYGLQLPHPPSVESAADRAQWVKEYIEGLVGHARFRQFFAVHETEAWLLSDPTIFPADIRKGFAAKTDRPETVNFDEPPAKMLDRVYQARKKHNYKKVTDGQQLFAKLDPEIAYKKCPNLKLMLDEMLRLARAAGP